MTKKSPAEGVIIGSGQTTIMAVPFDEDWEIACFEKAEQASNNDSLHG